MNKTHMSCHYNIGEISLKKVGFWNFSVFLTHSDAGIEIETTIRKIACVAGGIAWVGD